MQNSGLQAVYPHSEEVRTSSQLWLLSLGCTFKSLVEFKNMPGPPLVFFFHVVWVGARPWRLSRLIGNSAGQFR